MAKIEHIHHRLERWSLWVARGRAGPAGSGMLPMFRGYRPDNDGPREAPIPINEEECMATERAIMALPDPLNLTVCHYYLKDSDHTRRELAISRSVLSQRIERAHQLLDVALRPPPSPDAAKEQSWTRGREERSFPP